MTTMTRGPLPARVYWFRRTVVLLALAGLVLGSTQLVRLATGSSPEGPDRAAQVAAEPSEPAPTAGPSAAAVAPTDEKDGKQRDKRRKQKNKKNKKDREPKLPPPDGECVDSDIAVTPTLDDAVGGSPITIVLELRTIAAEACTWQVSPQSVTVKITSGKDDIWSSLDCPRAVPREDVVVRNSVSTEVEVTWSARRSDEGCTRNTAWALPGWYFVKAAALAGEPADLHFEVTTPRPDVVTEVVKPKSDKGKKQRARDRRGQGD
ncbi:hypothetical protein [Nocardioides coralli]|uniref:hypothetical protein n=1 Tax=Nocardioides coralli TaxID=2872154 RepID=UPI001CA3C868|nr:hypothetical protein [Nocardioides coralli]QZY29429.1 hypothetical protein K6T13_01605 [Nocardioides coralli]